MVVTEFFNATIASMGKACLSGYKDYSIDRGEYPCVRYDLPITENRSFRRFICITKA